MFWTNTDDAVLNYWKIKSGVGCETHRASDVKGQVNSCWKRIAHQACVGDVDPELSEGTELGAKYKFVQEC